VDGLHGACFLNFFEIHNLKFQNILKKIWVVDNDVIYMCIENKYSLRPILLFVSTDISTIKICLDTSMLAKSIMDPREYEICCILGCVKMTNFQTWGVNNEKFENL
jgi:hypothetical protein